MKVYCIACVRSNGASLSAMGFFGWRKKRKAAVAVYAQQGRQMAIGYFLNWQ